MTRSKRLDLVRDLEGRKVEEIERALRAARRNLDHQREQLTKLQQYMDEYQVRAVDAGAEHPGMFQERRAFLQRLGDAVVQAEQRVAASTRDYDAALACWHRRRGRVKALESASDRLRADDQLRRSREEQRGTDEVGARPANKWSDE